MKKDVKVNAFTLAEVLIVVGIIGIVAEMTIPTLITDITTTKFVGSWKKTYAVLQQAQTTIQNEYGSVSAGFGNIDDTVTGGNNFKNGWLPYLKVLKSCDAGTSVSAGCYNVPDGFTNMDNSAIINYASHVHTSSIILNDGTFLLFYPGTGIGPFTDDSYIFIDVNGADKPNVMGKDVFVLRYSNTKNMFQAHNARADGSLYPECQGNGWTCGAYYLFR